MQSGHLIIYKNRISHSSFTRFKTVLNPAVSYDHTNVCFTQEVMKVYTAGRFID